ncbi:hypothetical protein OF829_01630 [Sphingomonas sp. LB-2]|uniref:hypothetical protein n=1 Tax=Sphingomonas caeni TaxID=2984949 RepID=UPI00223131B9|nr:hypothetical protein [Sphingomonas caeni]MCW3845924.1 hypothetical protein [Sphingomonas caeni]
MMMVRKIAAAAALFLAAGTAHAQSQQSNKIEVGNWTIYSNADNCRAITDFEKGTVVSIALYAKNARTSMMILDSNVFSAVTDLQPFDAKLAFVKGEDLDTAWLGLPVMGAVLENGTKGVFITSTGDALLTSFGKSEIAGLLQGDKALVSFKTDPAADVAAALRKCVAGK